MKKDINIFILTIAIILFASMPAIAGTYSSPVNMHIAGSLTINGNPAVAGDEVAVYDNDGNVVGFFVVENSGLYGDLNISGDYLSSSEDEGAGEGESLTIKVKQASTDTVYSGEGVSISAPAEGTLVYSPYTKSSVEFEGGSFYLINIQAK